MGARTTASLVAAVLVGSLAGCGDERPPADPPAASEDVLVEARPSSVAGTTLWVQLPTGRLSVTVGDPVTTIPADESLEREDGVPQEIVAGDGQVFLPVQLDEEPGVGVPGVVYQAGTRDDPARPEVSIRVGGQDFLLGTTEEVGTRPVYARVDDGEDAGLALVVEFAGVAQSVDEDGTREPGEAAGLYDQQAELAPRACRGTWAGEPEANPAVECTYVVGHYPYLSELGWAHEQEAGGTWAFVATSTSVGTVELADGSRCDAAGLEGSGTTALDGDPAATDLDEVNTPTTSDGSFVSSSQAFLVADDTTRHDLRIERTYPCRDGGDVQDLRLTTEFPVDAR